MPSLHVVIIWALAVMFGGSLITLAVLYCTRDRGQRAARARPGRRDRQATQRRWQANLDRAQRYWARDRGRLAPLALPYRDERTAPPAATGLWQITDGEPPAYDPEAVEILSQALISASVRRVYADIEARQVADLVTTAWRTWQG